MRNHLRQWLSLLRWGTFLTLVAAGWLTYSQKSPIGNLYPLDSKITAWSGLSDPNILHYSMMGLAVFLGISGLLSFRCGDRYRTKYALPVFLSGLLLFAVSMLYSIQSGELFLSIATFVLPIALPFLLLRYRVWKNQVDHWNIVVCLLTAATLVSYGLQTLAQPIGTPTLLGMPMKMSDLSNELNQLITTIVAYVAIGTAIGLFITSLRRLALYFSVILGITISGASAYAYYSGGLSIFEASQILSILTLTCSYWLLPCLVLLSLASQRKTQTLKL